MTFAAAGRRYASEIGPRNATAFMYDMSGMHIGKLDITQIRLLAALSRSGSLSKAAQQIGISQSAASHALAASDRVRIRPTRSEISGKGWEL